MPEGDTVHRIARILSAELPGRTLDRIELSDLGVVRELAGRRIESVEAIGKHTLIHLEGDWSVRIHLGMHGRWRAQHVGEARPGRMTVALEVGESAFICYRAYRAELIRTRAIRSHPRLARLGPDLLADPPGIEDAVRRARLPAHSLREIGDVLLDQRVASGIGNIYKSEVLFETRVDPRRRLNEIDDPTLHAVFAMAARLMRLDLLTRGPSPVPVRRREKPTRTRLWVYDRAGKPCLDCGSPIERFLQGDMGRSTFVCPTCQG